MPKRVNIYIEGATKRTFACALDWPRWCRPAPTEPDALAELLAYGRRHASILAGTGPDFVAPTDLGQLVIVERLR